MSMHLYIPVTLVLCVCVLPGVCVEKVRFCHCWQMCLVYCVGACVMSVRYVGARVVAVLA